MSDHHGHTHGGDGPPGLRRTMFFIAVGLLLLIVLTPIAHKFGLVP